MIRVLDFPLMPYLLPLLSVLAGYGFAIGAQPKNRKNLKLLLSFSGAFLLSLTVMHVLPDVYASAFHHEQSLQGIGIFIMVGILFQILLEFFSKGAEHGHVHGHEEIHHMPWALFGSLCLHAFLEGFPVNNNHDLALGIAIHHLPIAVILTLFFVHAKLSPKIIFAFMLAFAAMTPLGTFAASSLPLLQEYYPQITAVVIGILFHISSTIIFEASENHKFNLAKLSMIALGILLAWLV